VTADEAGIGQLSPTVAERGGAIIGNARQLLDHGLTELRRIVLDVAAAGLRAADPGLAVDRLVLVDGSRLEAAGR